MVDLIPAKTTNGKSEIVSGRERIGPRRRDPHQPLSTRARDKSMASRQIARKYEPYFEARPRRRAINASCKWFLSARLRTVLPSITINSSCSRRKMPVRGASPVFSTTPSLIHCQNCGWVVQNCFRSRQMTSAVLAFFFFFLGGFLSVEFIKVIWRVWMSGPNVVRADSRPCMPVTQTFRSKAK